MRKSILVTGGAGYIGSHTCKALDRAGYQPVVYDDLSNGHREAVRWGPLVQGDVRDADTLSRAMRDHAVVGVVHFAGLIEVGRSMVRPDLFWDHNLNGVMAVLTAMRAAAVPRLVFSSTAAVYGAPVEGLEPLSESAVLCPINPYGDSKLAGERLIAASCAAFGMEAVALRYFNAAGADSDGELGEAHWPETHLIPLAIEAAIGDAGALTIFGNDFPTPDGSCVRDYIHVADLARAHVLALAAPSAPGGFEALNLGTGHGASVLEVVEAVARACEQRPPVITGDRRVGDPPMLVADASQAQTRLGWAPEVSSLQAIVDSAVAWRRTARFGPAALAPAPTPVALAAVA